MTTQTIKAGELIDWEQEAKVGDPFGEAFTEFAESLGIKMVDCTPKKSRPNSDHDDPGEFLLDEEKGEL